MTDAEKITLKAALQREQEDLDQYLTQKQERLRRNHGSSQDLLEETKCMIDTYNMAVENITKAAANNLEATLLAT
eukprot:CAMPEP_0170541486 /NCGR_PEP_ID=MMETSP0211-20121228/1211_1 /TAXON_ID=311385 /ORGANISM="Pseudokeronopsis sp., Strain OXSARD2" /LENGTH=74 /DNA_ID=CAMNT_0010844239 /DNA_START=135 /DNA_END=359 /DNA_ORIENTATION=+